MDDPWRTPVFLRSLSTLSVLCTVSTIDTHCVIHEGVDNFCGRGGRERWVRVRERGIYGGSASKPPPKGKPLWKPIWHMKPVCRAVVQCADVFGTILRHGVCTFTQFGRTQFAPTVAIPFDLVHTDTVTHYISGRGELCSPALPQASFVICRVYKGQSPFGGVWGKNLPLPVAEKGRWAPNEEQVLGSRFIGNAARRFRIEVSPAFPRPTSPPNYSMRFLISSSTSAKAGSSLSSSSMRRQALMAVVWSLREKSVLMRL